MTRGIPIPNYFKFPNEIVDQYLHLLSGSELKVLLYILRRTFGFNKDHDHISYDQFLNGIVIGNGERLDHGAGIASPSTLSKALAGLERKNLIWAEKNTAPGGDKAVSIYGVVWRNELGELQKLKHGVLYPLGDADTGEGGLTMKGEKAAASNGSSGTDSYTGGKYADFIET